MTESMPGISYKHGWVEVIVGSMYSGKTEELIKRIRRAQFARARIQVFKPTIDNRYSDTDIASHSLQKLPSILVNTSREILEKLEDHTRVVGIDEAQFFDSGIVEVVQKLADRGLRVVLAGLDTDWEGKPFGPMPHLMAIAENVTKQNAICMSCGAPASRTQRLIKAGDQVLVGAADMYEARCRGCFDPYLARRKYHQPFAEA